MAGPQTLATGNAIVSYLTGLTYSSGNPVYTFVQLEQINNVVTLLEQNTMQAVGEVYCNLDANQTVAFGGVKWDVQTWLVLSMTSLDSPTTAAQIYNVRDAIIGQIAGHYALGGTASGLFWAQWKQPETGRFLRIERNAQEVQAHIAELETRVQWTATLAP